MLAYILRRIGISLMILFGSSFLVYNLAAYASDPLEELRFSTDDSAKQQIAALTRDLNLDLAPPLRYFLWLRGVLGIFTGQFDLGMTRSASTVQSQLAYAIPVTLRLVLVATITALVIGLALGIMSALRQYSRFDYSMTFFAFLLYSLPIFWVAVLLKEFMAIQFNNFLENPIISLNWIIGASLFAGIFWSALLGGNRRRFWSVFASAAAVNAIILFLINFTDWFKDPGLGPIVIFVLTVSAALLLSQLSPDTTARAIRKATLIMSFLALLWYYPAQWFLNTNFSSITLFGLAVGVAITGAVVGHFCSKTDRSPVIRAATFIGLVGGGLILVDRLLQSWVPYVTSDAVNGRPIPTFGQRKSELVTDDVWLNNLDIVTHLALPTLALILISLAGWIRYSRGALLEVLNQDYIRTARSKGLSERTVITRHAFRNMMLPLSSLFVGEMVGLVSGAVITERVFGWQGMGTLGIQAINGDDLNLLMGVNLLLSILVIGGNLAADLVYSVLDPRIRIGK